MILKPVLKLCKNLCRTHAHYRQILSHSATSKVLFKKNITDLAMTSNTVLDKHGKSRHPLSYLRSYC